MPSQGQGQEGIVPHIIIFDQDEFCAYDVQIISQIVACLRKRYDQASTLIGFYADRESSSTMYMKLLDFDESSYRIDTHVWLQHVRFDPLMLSVLHHNVMYRLPLRSIIIYLYYHDKRHVHIISSKVRTVRPTSQLRKTIIKELKQIKIIITSREQVSSQIYPSNLCYNVQKNEFCVGLRTG